MSWLVTPPIPQSPTTRSAARPTSRTQSNERTTARRCGASRSRLPALCDPAYSSISRSPSVGVDVAELTGVGVEELREHLLRCGRRGGPAVAAVLDHGAHDDRRLVERPVAAPPRLVLEAGDSRKRDDLLGGARLAGDRDGEVAEHAVRRPERHVRPPVEPLLHDMEVRLVESRDRARRGGGRGRDERLVRVLDVEEDVRLHELAAVRDRRVEARHLQRRHREVSLADRELDRVARLPEAVDLPAARIRLARVAVVLPPDRRQKAACLRPDLDRRLPPEAELARPPLLRLAAVWGQ